MSFDATYVLLVALLLTALLWLRERHDNRPPGPVGLPLIGNLHQLPATYQHLAFMKWGSRYGDIVYVKLLGQPVIVLNSLQAAVDLMEKRSAKYSGRPRFTFFIELMGWDNALPLTDYGDKFKRHRRWFQSALVARASLNKYRQLQLREARKLLLDLMQDSERFAFHLRRFTAAVVLEIGYGYTITSMDDDCIHVVEKGISLALEGSSAGGALVDLLPFMKYIPRWIPGAEFQHVAAEARASIRAMEDIPYDRVKAEMTTGTARPSFVKTMIQDCGRKGGLTAADEGDIKGAAGVLYATGTDTTRTSMIVFILAMVLNPQVVEKAQEEIDRVVGNTRLPDFSDRESLPYVECIVLEVYRYCPPTPLGVAHRLDEDDVYRGYHIPRDSTVFTNIWAMSRDPDVYPEPEAFRPERYLGRRVREDEYADHMDPRKMVFGFGRRICPGRLLADRNVWLVVASVLATMDIRKARDASGEEINVTPVFQSGTVIHPAPFGCDIRPRSKRARELILAGGTEI